MTRNESDPPASDVIRMLIATDNHLGYGEKSAIKADDSFVTFEEILDVAIQQEVDFVLLGGDLFHDNKPSRQVIMRCYEILQKRVFGDRPVGVHLVSDPETNFGHCSGRKDVNYTNPDLNIGLPIFSIHGNHDDPAGIGGFSVLDMLHTSGLVNYIGKITNLKEIEVSPVLLKKGNAKLAIYGMSSVKDERMHRLFRENKVTFFRPEGDTEEWFNLLVVHQNRARHGGPTNYLPEHFIDGMFDLVLWGHEHECRISPEKVVFGDEKAFHVTQPGSSVATSLSEGETKSKKVAVVEVHKRMFKMNEIELKTVRPMVFRTICIEEEIDFSTVISEKKIQEKIEKFLVDYIEDLLEKEVPKLITGHPRQPTLPQVRVRVEYRDEAHQLSAARFGNNFHDKVANPSEVLLFRKKVERKSKGDFFDEELMEDHMPVKVTGTSMEDLITQYFEDPENKNNLKLLGVKGISTAVKKFVQKDDKDAIAYIVDRQFSKILDAIGGDIDDCQVDDKLDEIRQQRTEATEKQEIKELDEALEAPHRERTDYTQVQEEISDENVRPNPPSPRRGRGRGSRGSRGAARGRGKQSVVEESDEEPPSKGRGTRGGRSRGKNTNQNIRQMFARQSQSSNTSRLPKGTVISYSDDTDED